MNYREDKGGLVYEYIAFVAQMIIYGSGIIMSIGAYILYRGEFKEERKQCIVFSLGMGIISIVWQVLAIAMIIILYGAGSI